MGINYEMKLTNTGKKINRKETLIFFGNKESFKLLKDGNFIEFFIDVTFKIIPKCYKPHKLISLVALDNKSNQTKIICFVFIRYLDSIT